MDTLLANWEEMTTECNYGEVNRNLLETKNKQALLEAAKTNAHFNKDKSMVIMFRFTSLHFKQTLTYSVTYLRSSNASGIHRSTHAPPPARSQTRTRALTQTRKETHAHERTNARKHLRKHARMRAQAPARTHSPSQANRWSITGQILFNRSSTNQPISFELVNNGSK